MPSPLPDLRGCFQFSVFPVEAVPEPLPDFPVNAYVVHPLSRVVDCSARRDHRRARAGRGGFGGGLSVFPFFAEPAPLPDLTTFALVVDPLVGIAGRSPGGECGGAGFVRDFFADDGKGTVARFRPVPEPLIDPIFGAVVVDDLVGVARGSAVGERRWTGTGFGGQRRGLSVFPYAAEPVPLPDLTF